MAEKSKRATTSAPRTRGQKASKSSKDVAKDAAKEAAKPTTVTKKTSASTKKSQATKAPSVTTTAPETPELAEAPADAEARATTEAPIAKEPPAAETPATADVDVNAEASAKPAKTATKKKKKATDAAPKASPKKSKKAAASSEPELPVEGASTETSPIDAPAAPASSPSVAVPAPIAVPVSSAAALEEPKAPARRASRTGKKKVEKKKASKASAATRASSLPLKQYEFIGVPSFKGQAIEDRPAVLAPPPPPPKQLTLEERLETLQGRLAKQGEGVRSQLQEQLDMSWIYHDSALEGVVYSFQELKTALGPDQTLVQESNLQPVIDEIRRHRAAIELVRECAKKKTPITLDLIKRIYLTLHPEEGDLKTVKYRKDIPQHRLYFHEYAAPDKIAGKVRQVVDWLNEPETQKGRNALRVAARAHYDLLRAFPFQTDSGKVARLLMNLLLLQSGYEPAIIHSTERQRYYDALKGSAPTIISMVLEAEENAVMSLEKLLDELETRGRGYAG